jgi:long-chain-fatty-acid--CoA ligase ACSBG
VNSAPEACKYIAENCRANILVVEDEKQLEKILKFKSEVDHIKVIVTFCEV